MPDLLRRVAALIGVSVVGISLLAPLAARSVASAASEADVAALAAPTLIMGAAWPVSGLDRGATSDRATTLTSIGLGSDTPLPETLSTTAIPQPPTAFMEATLVTPWRVTAPAPRVTVVAAPPPGEVVEGTATWYCCSRGWRGEAVVALPGALGGRYSEPPATLYVTVCADRCAELPVVDYCGCYWGTASQRVADLSPEAWAAISDADLSQGVITVTVTFGG